MIKIGIKLVHTNTNRIEKLKAHLSITPSMSLESLSLIFALCVSVWVHTRAHLMYSSHVSRGLVTAFRSSSATLFSNSIFRISNSTLTAEEDEGEGAADTNAVAERPLLTGWMFSLKCSNCSIDTTRSSPPRRVTPCLLSALPLLAIEVKNGIGNFGSVR